MQKLNK